MKRATCAINTLLLIWALFAPAAAFASADPPAKKWVIIVADRVSLQDIADPSLRNIGRMLSGGAIGLMNTRTSGKTERASACATIGAGIRAAGSSTSNLAAHVDSVVNDNPVGDTFKTLTAEEPPKGGIVNLGIASLSARNEKSDWRAGPGLLGATLMDHGFTTALVGNADTDREFHREASLIVMDARGVVRHGYVSRKLLVRESGAPFGLAFDMELLKDSFLENHLRSSVTVVDFGETERVEAIREDTTEMARTVAWSKAMERLDDFVGFVLRSVDLPTTGVMLVSPTPSALAMTEKRSLTPILMIGPGIGPGILTSSSTRRRGLVTNMDVAPTVLLALGVEPPDAMLGSRIESRRTESALEFLLKFHDKNQIVESLSWLLRVILIFQIVVFALAWLTAAWLDRARGSWLGLMNFLLTLAASADLALLLAAPLGANSVPAYIAAILATAGIITGVVMMLPGPVWRVSALAALYIAAIVGDQFAGGPLAGGSVMGYYPQIGARFYGLGNEYMGFLVGAPLALAAFMLDSERWRRFAAWAALPFMLFVMVVTGAPNLGANTGGLISTGAAFIPAALVLLGRRFSWKSVALVVAGLAVIVAAFTVYDAFFSGSASHLGRLVERAAGDGPGEITKVVLRKLETNFRLLRVSTWGVLFAVMAATAAAVYFFPVKAVENIFQKRPGLRKLFAVNLIGAAAAFLANDSGVTPGATCLILSLTAVFSLAIAERQHTQTKS